MELCGEPTLTSTHSDVCLFSCNLLNLSHKKLSMRFNRKSEIPPDLSLNISPLCLTLSDALAMSQKNITTFKLGKDQKLCISYKQLTKADLHMSHLNESQIDGLMFFP